MLRTVYGLLLMVVLSLTSVKAAVARGQMAGATEMVICAGATVAQVTLDATGKLVDAHHCPVCTAANHGATGPAAMPIAAPAAWSAAAWPVAKPAMPAGQAVLAVARGPPHFL